MSEPAEEIARLRGLLREAKFVLAFVEYGAEGGACPECSGYPHMEVCRLRDVLQDLAAELGEDPLRPTWEAAHYGHAVISAFQGLQACGYFLHDEHGHVLDQEGFKQAMVVMMAAALALPLPPVSDRTDPP